MISQFFTTYYTVAAIILGSVALYFLWAWKWPSYSKATLPKSEQQMLFQGTALSWLDDHIDKLNHKICDRSLEIAKSDSRFLVTPDDMNQAYQEIIREEHM